MQSLDPYYSSSGQGVKLFDRAVSEDYDIAPTIKSYRDRTQEQYRQLGVARRITSTSAAPTPRTQKTQLSLITDPIRRESLGFKSLGEIAAVNVFRTGRPQYRRPTRSWTPTASSVSASLIATLPATRSSGPNLMQGLSTGMLGISRTGQRIAFSPRSSLRVQPRSTACPTSRALPC